MQKMILIFLKTNLFIKALGVFRFRQPFRAGISFLVS